MTKIFIILLVRNIRLLLSVRTSFTIRIAIFLYFSVDGTSDDLDVPIKKVFGDVNYVLEHNLCSINSINWARILVQVQKRQFLFYSNIFVHTCLFI